MNNDDEKLDGAAGGDRTPPQRANNLSARPIKRLISWVRPPTFPRRDSRSERVCVERGSIS